jgi:sterol desaturase/sphingolipid hydroxylase (fatty acid hydroxylase superfamily)
MQSLATLYTGLIEAWRNLPLGTLEMACLKAVIIGAFVFLVAHAIERWYAMRDDYYFMSRGFAHNLVYWFYYRMRLDSILYFSALVAVLEGPLSFLDLRLASSSPVVLQAFLVLVVGDLAGYWIHRAQHHFKFLWAFHTTHHSCEQLTVFTGARFHPVDTLFMMIAVYVPLRVLGASAEMSTWTAFLAWFLNMLIHSRIPWGYGPLRWVLVSPSFHAFHHSIDPAHHNKNFSSGIFSFWDYLFGTAVKDQRQVPTRFGLPDATPTSFWSTLATPFRLLGEFYLPPAGHKQPGSR